MLQMIQGDRANNMRHPVSWEGSLMQKLRIYAMPKRPPGSYAPDWSIWQEGRRPRPHICNWMNGRREREPERERERESERERKRVREKKDLDAQKNIEQ